MKRRYIIAAVVGGFIFLTPMLVAIFVGTRHSYFQVESLAHSVDYANLEEPHQQWFTLSAACFLNEHSFDYAMRGAAI